MEGLHRLSGLGRLRILQAEVARERDTWWRCCPWDPTTDKRLKMDGYIVLLCTKIATIYDFTKSKYIATQMGLYYIAYFICDVFRI